MISGLTFDEIEILVSCLRHTANDIESGAVIPWLADEDCVAIIRQADQLEEKLKGKI